NRKKYEISQKEPTIDQENIPNTYGGQLVADEDSQPLETVHEEKDNTLEINSVLGDEPFDIDDLQDDALLFPEEVTDKTTTYNPVIKNITLHNFKSYHGIHSIDMTNFTTIVGPNGSGKSNLLDAILFIFGYQAKKMRQTKIQELIHKDCHTCSVEITFLLSEHDQEENLNHNEEKYDHKSEDKSQEKKDDCSMEKDKSKSQKFIRLKREISGNKSTYYFDREKISTEQLKMNLLKYNIPLENNRFMILQGEIEAIAQMKPKDEQNGGILEYLEEIIGTNRYIPKIRQIEEKMVDVKEKYEYTKNIYKLKERENQNNVKILEGIKINVKNKYEEIKIEESLYDLKKNLQREKNKKIGEENKELEKELKTMQKSEQVSELKKLEKELKEKKNLNHKLEREYLVKKSHYTKIKRENEHKKKEREQKEKEIEELKKEIKKCEEKILIDKKEVEEIDSKIMTYDNDLKELESRIKNKTEELSILLNNSKNQDKRNKLNTMIKTLENELLIKRRETHNTIHLNQLNDIVEKLRYIHNLVEPKKKFNEEPVNKSNEEPVNKLNEEQDIIQSIKKLKTDLHSINQTIYKKEEKIRTIQTDDGPSTIHHFRNIQFNDDCSNKESRKNTVHGKLSDLISTSKKYDTAITSALKSHLNSIIVSDERTAKECIRIVKEKKLQRTTFLIMDQIKAYTFKKDPNMIYAIDLIECNNEYSDIVSFLIKDTVLFEDFNTSLKETKNKKLRAVTLKGELIEKSGLITRTPVNGALSKRNNHSNEETLRNELERINSAKCNLIKKIEELENVVERLPELKRYQNIMRVKEYFNKTLRERVSEIIQ
ncbi:Structural maintenance of chromosome protein, partial [Pseudoloma neurophilia]